ncbi:MAG: DNA repair protein RecO [Desulfobulbaceae bacterium]|nr:MAG: DNA repair protein RecO [Desulfobulbaceae bacterium]
MPTIRTDLPAVVLDSRDHGESDKILTLYCKDVGRLTAIAKGAHRSKKRFVNKLELFSLITLTYSRSAPQRMAVLNEAELIESFLPIRTSSAIFHSGSVVRECLLLGTTEGLSDNQLFDLIAWVLQELSQHSNPREVITYFLIKLFDCIGYRPILSKCQNCGLDYPGEGEALFSSNGGGLICSNCIRAGNYYGRKLQAGTIQTLASIQSRPLNQLRNIRLSDPLLNESLESLFHYARYLFQREIFSWKLFLSATAKMAGNHYR